MIRQIYDQYFNGVKLMNEEYPNWVNQAQNRYVSDCVHDGSSDRAKCLTELLWPTYWVLYSETSIRDIKNIREKILFETRSPKRYPDDALDFVIKIISDLLGIQGSTSVEELKDFRLDNNYTYKPPTGELDECVKSVILRDSYIQALRGDRNACHYLSKCYREGKEGVQQDAGKAKYWELKATCEKNTTSRHNTPKDEVFAQGKSDAAKTDATIKPEPGTPSKEVKAKFKMRGVAPGTTDSLSKPVSSGTRIIFTDSSSGATVKWEWDFGSYGKETTKGPHSVKFVNRTPGEVREKISLRVFDVNGTSSIVETYITVSPESVVPEELTAGIMTIPITFGHVDSGTVLTFTDNSTGNPDRWEWDFGSYGKKQTKGPHSVKFVNDTSVDMKERISLRVYSEGGKKTDITTFSLTVKPAPISSYKPKAAFNIPAAPIKSGTAVTFVDSSTGNLGWWEWDFGSSGTRTGKGPHTVTLVNKTSVDMKEKISLRVFDKRGNTDTAECYVTVKPAPAKPTPVKQPDVRSASPFKANIQIKGAYHYSGDKIVVKHGTSLLFSATPIDSSTTYHWEGGNDAEPRSFIRDGVGPYSIRFTSPDYHESTCYLTLYVSHADGIKSSEELKFKIINKEIGDVVTSPPELGRNAKPEIQQCYDKAVRGVLAEQNKLGECYETGAGVDKDLNKAFFWYQTSANVRYNYAEAQFNLGRCYHGGYGTHKNKTEAAKWYRKAANHGDNNAKLFLAVCYEHGIGIEQNPAEALKWCTQAAEAGIYEACNKLGFSYKYGHLGVQKDEKKSEKWYEQARSVENNAQNKARERISKQYKKLFSWLDR